MSFNSRNNPIKPGTKRFAFNVERNGRNFPFVMYSASREEAISSVKKCWGENVNFTEVGE